MSYHVTRYACFALIRYFLEFELVVETTHQFILFTGHLRSFSDETIRLIIHWTMRQMIACLVNTNQIYNYTLLFLAATNVSHFRDFEKSLII